MNVGFWQLILILLIVMILFGSGKLPQVMKELGKGIKNFKKEVHEDKKEQESNPDLDK